MQHAHWGSGKMEKRELAPGIVIYSNVMTDSKSIVDEIEYCVEQKITSWIDGEIKDSNESPSYSNKKVRDTDTMGVQYFSYIDENPSNPEDSFKKTLNNYFYSHFDECEKDYKATYGLETEWHDQWNILKYGVNQHFMNHVDDHITFHRRMSIVYYMNDDYEGGEINFPRFNLSIKPKAHDLLVFPSAYVYNHSVSPVTSGTRYAVVSWLR